MKEKIKSLINKDNRAKLLNLVYSILATAVFNAVLQIVIYPSFADRLGTADYGVALSAISLLAIVAGTCGYAVNCSRLLGVKQNRTQNGDYNLILLAMGTVGSLIGVGSLGYIGILSPVSAVLFSVLTGFTMLRYYSEVELRLSANFLRYMIYYFLISAGYIIGLLVFRLTGSWMATLIIGEAMAVLYVVIRGSIYRSPLLRPTKDFLPILASIGFIFLSSLIDNVTLHADRILLLSITGDGTAVTIYYAASLVGKIVAMLTLPINALLLSYLVRYKGELSRKLWTVVIGGASAFGALGFVGCIAVSPLFIKILYSADILSLALPYVVPAILGQIFYFVSGMLMIVLLHFKGEKKQLIFNACYAVIFFACVIVGTSLGGLSGFVWSVCAANAARFAIAVIWGFIGKKK